MKIKLNILFLVILTMQTVSSCSDENDGPIVDTPSFNCNDGIRNGDETGIDCGGSCSPCTPELSIPETGFDSPVNYEGYDLVWNDEFEENNLNADIWSYHLGSGCPNLCGWGNNEMQYYTNKSENLYFKNGNLIIEAKYKKTGGKDYSSSRIHSDNKFEFKYGRIDIRASMPSATGTWVALWLLNQNYTIDKPDEWWPKGGEIDIMEFLGESPHEILGTAHYGSSLNNHNYNSVKYIAPEGRYDSKYYVYSIIWEKNKIRWLVNDKEYHSITPADTNGQPYPFNDKFYLIMNLSVGGNLPVDPKAKEYPAFLIVDYIRVFQKN